MFSRIGQIIFSLMTSRFEGIVSATMMAVIHEFMKKGRQTLLLIMSSLLFSILLAAGIIISMLEASAQYDAKGTIFFTALLGSSLTLCGISVLGLLFIFWPRQTTIPSTAPAPHKEPHPIEEIFMNAFNEVVHYFKDRNQQTSAGHSK